METARLQSEFLPSVDMAKCVGIEPGYIKIKMRGEVYIKTGGGLRGDCVGTKK